MDGQLALLLRLLAAHLLADFALSPLVRPRGEEDSRAQWRSPQPYLHGLIAAVLAYACVARWSAFWLLPAFFVVHVLSDMVGPGKEENRISFLDQAGHVVILFVVWLVLMGPARVGPVLYAARLAASPGFWVLTVAYAVVLWPCGVLVGRLTERWREEAQAGSQGLTDAGLWIGRLERVLVLTFVLLQRFEAVGFLIAAKSVLRIGEVTRHNDRKQAEYILVGTMFSISLAITVGLFAVQLLS